MLYVKFNIDLSRRTKHNALLDCELLREVYINLLDVKEPQFNLSSNPQTEEYKRTYSKTIIKISDNEINKHKEFLKSDLKLLLSFPKFLKINIFTYELSKQIFFLTLDKSLLVFR